ncbi:DUF1624 domain-containing protein [Mucilaginibacter mali]|uniref:DUF1624 domain-containing protein n=1 Tax=Mucilaginibacter mali TaxID=2740462 RepID=A0A7D4UNW6_9SPHI|nr:heparan-alpha-glucosaminide N-acetyltransferase domain-containing protein [Mucilaginibacter mali]QKJ29440.1 DUF1624 domain-containing protein [Mucilaginibacter mali]
MTAQPLTAKHRIESIDILRGLIMLIMAIDHTRDFFHAGHPEPTDLAVTTPLLFFTRWITHFCAPIFVFLSGVSAYLAGTRRTKSQFSAFLIKRGLWLLAIEFLVVRLAQTGDPFFHTIIFQVIWAIGGSMVLLGLLVWAPLTVICIIGALIFFGHDILYLVNVGAVGNTFLWKLLLSGRGFGDVWVIDSDHIMIMAYALLPWTGVMLLGYVFGTLYKKDADAAKRRKTLLNWGLGLLALFVVLRYFNFYGDPAPWSSQKTASLSIISFFNVSKYPPSLLYLCMTLGAALIALSQTETVKNKLTDILVIYGNVPMFYYLCHWYLLLITFISLYLGSGYHLNQFDPKTGQPPASFGYGLGGVYLVWLIAIIILYFPCRWYSKYKRAHTQWWLSYL